MQLEHARAALTGGRAADSIEQQARGKLAHGGNRLRHGGKARAERVRPGATTDLRPYDNVLLKKGVVRP
jgi:hypothetical protein